MALEMEYLQTPSASTTPEMGLQTGPEKMSLETQLSIKQAQKTPFARQRMNDRSTVKRHIERYFETRGAKPGIKVNEATSNDRWQLMLSLWNEKITEREQAGKGSTRRNFPAQHNQKEEEKWLKTISNNSYCKRVAPSDECCGVQDCDDEEQPLPPLGIKIEPGLGMKQSAVTRSNAKGKKSNRLPTESESESELSDASSFGENSDSENEQSDEDEGNDAESSRDEKAVEKPKKGTCVACTRVLAIELGVPKINEDEPLGSSKKPGARQLDPKTGRKIVAEIKATSRAVSGKRSGK